MAKELGDRKMAKTISIKGSTIMKLEELASNMKGENGSSLIEKLIEREHKSMFPVKSDE